MPNPAIVPDLAARWRPLNAQQTTNAEAFLTDAWSYLTDLMPTLEQRLVEGTVNEDSVIRVVSSMVLRVLRNPDAKVQESLDDYAYRRSDLVADGLLYATGDELASLSGRRRSSAYTIRPFR